jgi:hypothetical protein
MPIFDNLGNSQENYTNQINFSTIPLKENRHGKHKNPNYHREYYQKNRDKFLAYGQIYYGVKKFSFLAQAGDIYTNSLIDKKVYEVAWGKARDRQDIRLATKGKRPQYPKGSY